VDRSTKKFGKRKRVLKNKRRWEGVENGNGDCFNAGSGGGSDDQQVKGVRDKRELKVKRMQVAGLEAEGGGGLERKVSGTGNLSSSKGGRKSMRDAEKSTLDGKNKREEKKLRKGLWEGGH